MPEQPLLDSWQVHTPIRKGGFRVIKGPEILGDALALEVR